jgi:4'-phosphopantetheinyl transferase EntD
MSLTSSAAKNPASMSASLASLFPPGIRAAELREAADPALLHPEEAVHVAKAVASRVQEFAAGRLCARRVLAEFGVLNYPLKAAEDRQPLWPANLVGSITHTEGFGAAVAAEKNRIAAIGIDSEVAGRVKQELWPSICTEGEIAWLHTRPQLERGVAATLIFAAKEAFYKCQYPLTAEWLNFHDVTVEVPAWDAARGVFSVRANRSIGFARCARLPIEGQFLIHEQFVTAAVAVTAR